MNVSLKTIVLASITIPLIAMLAFAQPPGDADFKKVKLLKERLDLTDEQADSIYSTLKNHDFKKCDGVTSFTKKNECFKNLRSSKDAEMKSVLSKAQKTQLEDFKKECSENHGPRKAASKKESGEPKSCKG